MRVDTVAKKVGVGLFAVCATTLVVGCDRFDPVEYMAQNICELLNCDVLFFVEDLLGVSGGAEGGGGAMSMPMSSEADSDDGGGHAH